MRKEGQSIGIVADSSCDLTPEWKEKTDIKLVPFRVDVGKNEYVDDGNVEISELIKDMRQTKECAKSACPSVGEYANHMRTFDVCFVVTLSSKLSGSYNAACVAAEMVKEESPEKQIYVLDSKSATAGEVALGLYLYDLITEGKEPEEIYTLALAYMERCLTLFMLIDLDNLVKNGRITKFSKLASSALHLRPIMSDDGNGEIILLKTVRGTKNALFKMVDMVKEKTNHLPEKSIRLVMTYCNCYDQATQVKERLLTYCPALKEVVIMPTGALSSMYANDGGIVLAFA